MKKFRYSFFALVICLLTQNCKQNKPEEFINFTKVKIDPEHFVVSIYSKTKVDSTLLYSDTLLGEIRHGEEFKTEWFDDSVKCKVPDYIPEKTFRTKSNLKVILKH
jgi:hypothetical protein